MCKHVWEYIFHYHHMNFAISSIEVWWEIYILNQLTLFWSVWKKKRQQIIESLIKVSIRWWHRVSLINLIYWIGFTQNVIKWFSSNVNKTTSIKCDKSRHEIYFNIILSLELVETSFQIIIIIIIYHSINMNRDLNGWNSLCKVNVKTEWEKWEFAQKCVDWHVGSRNTSTINVIDMWKMCYYIKSC